MKWVIGNWKMHKTGKEGSSFLAKLLEKPSRFSKKVGLAVPFPFLERAVSLVKNSPIWIGSQNIYEKEEGPFTGEVSASMVQDTGAKFVLIGHSERRKLFQETEEKIQNKLHLALKNKLAPILCIGETKEEREKGFQKVLKHQLEQGLQKIAPLPENLFIAYEPVWAIGTGMTASADMAEEAHEMIYQVLQEKWGKEAKKVPVLYGGSVNLKNITSLLEKPSIQGALVGGASLDINQFLEMI